MDKKRLLTIDPIPTRAKVKADGRTISSYARLRGFPVSTLQRIVAGDYPHNENPESEYQKALLVLKKDGYLVEVKGAR